MFDIINLIDFLKLSLTPMNSSIFVAEERKITSFVLPILSPSLSASNHFLTFRSSLFTISCKVNKLSDSKNILASSASK